MILSKETITVLQNFQQINPSIVLRPGNEIATQSVSEAIAARASVPDTFPRTIPIYDLSKFLGILSLDKEHDSEIEFLENKLIIKQGSSIVHYAYAHEDQIISPPVGKSIKVRDPTVSFVMTQPVWARLAQAMRVMGFSEFAFVGENDELSIQALSTMSSESDTYSTTIGETDKTFKAVIEAHNMRIISGDYNVSICGDKGFVHFHGELAEYFIGLSTKSDFGE